MQNDKIFKYKISFTVKFDDGSEVPDETIIEAQNIMQAVNSAYARLRKLDFWITEVVQIDESPLYVQLIGRAKRIMK